nr:TetR/AcrR family transcriptional regulator [Rhizobium sp. L245/93]
MTTPVCQISDFEVDVKAVFERQDVVRLLAEVFRDLGYDGTTLNSITERIGVGKGSLYHFFPGGKEEMAAAVLADVDALFEREIYEPLRRGEPNAAIAAMLDNVVIYFRSGSRICLVGTFAMVATRDTFGASIASYFRRWIAALSDALRRAGQPVDLADIEAERMVMTIQGGIVLARALDDTEVFRRAVENMRAVYR